MALRYKQEYERYHAIMMTFRSGYDNCKEALGEQYFFSVDAIIHAPEMADSDRIILVQKHTAAYKKVKRELEKMYKEAEYIGNIPVFKDQLQSPTTSKLRKLMEAKGS